MDIRWPITAVLMLLACLGCTGQDASLVPDLRKDLAQATNDTARADALARICFNLIRSDPDSARLTGMQALAIARRIGNRRALGDAHNNLGWLEAEQGRLDSAEAHLQEALRIFEGIGRDDFIAATRSNLGWVASKRADLVGAVNHFLAGLKHSEAANDSASTSKLLYSIGTTYRRMKVFEQAVEFLERSRSMEQALGRPNAEANCHIALGNVLKEQGDSARAVVEFGRADALYTGLHDHYGMGIVAENIGGLYVDSDPRRALGYYLVAQAHYDTVHSSTDLAYILAAIGDARIALGELQSAERDLARGAALAASAGDGELTTNYAMSMAALARAKGDAQGVFEHLQRAMALKDSLQGADTQRELARLRTAFDTERKEKENAVLRSENETRKASEERLRLRWIAAVIVAIALVALLLLLWRNYRLRGRHTREVERFNAELAAQRDEVQRMNDLLELKVLRSQLNPHFVHNCQNSATALVREERYSEALTYLQGLSRLMRMVLDQSVRDRIGIEEEADFLRLYLEIESLRVPGLICAVEVDGSLVEEEASLPALLVQPFVENALWHGLPPRSGVRSLRVVFTARDGGLRCIVRDNGVGRAKAAPRPDGHRSLGTELTNERLRLLTHRLQQKGSYVINDLLDTDGTPAGTEVIIDLEG